MRGTQAVPSVRRGKGLLPLAGLIIVAGAAGTVSAPAADFQVTLGGQYRINAYAADNDIAGEETQSAARLRLRQSLDLAFDDHFKTHLQVELGHTTDNLATTGSSTRANRLEVRHAVLEYTFGNGIDAQAGIVPLGDRFQDTLFSSDWNYNPLALALTFPVGKGKLRAFAGKLSEGSETAAKDDFSHYQVDYVIPFGEGSRISLGGTALVMGSNGTTRDLGPTAITTGIHYNYALGGTFVVGRWTLNGLALGSRTQGRLLGTKDDGSGFAAKLELTGRAGAGSFGLLGTWALGASDGTGFQAPLAFTPAVGKGANSYWGYTGILTVQGPTDTGFDGDSLNISNNGYGLASVQAKWASRAYGPLRGYVAAGWFGGSRAAGRSRSVGAEVMAIGTYRFGKALAFDAGAGYARLDDSVSGYHQGAAGAFNQPPGAKRGKRALFARLQAEF